MEMLLKAGLSPMDVILAATRNAALVCGHGDELGTLGPGKLADIIVVDGDPLKEPVGALRFFLCRDGPFLYNQQAERVCGVVYGEE